MAIAQYSVALRNAMLDAKETYLISGGAPVLKIFTGNQPADCATANSGTELVSMALPADPFAAAASGAKSKQGTWSGTGIAAGVAGHYRLYLNNGTTCVEQGDVTDQMTLDTTTISIGLPVTVATFTFTAGNA